MEFFLTLTVLYAAQCLLKLDRDETVGMRWRFPRDPARGRTRLVRGDGWCLIHPWPAAFVFSGHTRIPVERPPTDLRDLARDFETARRKTRALRWLSSLQLVWVLALGPVGAISIGPEATLLVGLGPALGFHLIAVALLFRAQRAVLPDDPKAGDRLWIAALYPPALLRAGSEIVRLAFADRPFIEVAGPILDDARFEELLRREIGRARSPRHGFDGGDENPPEGPDRRIDWLLTVAEMRSFDREQALAPRPRFDPTAESYCEACGDDFVPGYRFCRECQLETTEYPPAVPSGK